MDLHIPTLVLVDVYILALLGILAGRAWRRGTPEPTLGYLSLTLLLGAFCTVLGSLRGLGIDWVPIIIGNLLLQLSCAASWTSMRVFAGRPIHFAGFLAGPLLWLALCAVPAFYASLPARIMLSCVLMITYTALAAFELWRARRSLQVSIAPAMALHLMHVATYGVRLVVDRGEPFQRLANGQASPFFAILVFETLLYAIGVAFVTLAMVRERAELQYKHAAYSDPLTGVGNRRAFMDSGQALLERCARRGEGVMLLLCDLDNFKRLNDSFGHASGDAALVGFTRIAAARMRRHDVFGRIGGEEFACLLADADGATAMRVAERIRHEFAESCPEAPGPLSVSIGVTGSGEAGYDLSRLLSLADKALYRAKAQGRNRVECYREVVATPSGESAA
ncbi:GGDEF domain-containing protein [Pseudomonas sp. ENNP23]|uniref:GGDEF domain-containing protein n=1 Tax=Pseudomonas sp. ENNP23 TaxID=1535636 RepID=UPI00084A6DE2|nr:GGDEF domain-containing protein [Pseudomonas sp. ENNP23]OEC61664.1 diguanylate cyclase [Pseudomonas sp. ENNP23]